MMAVNLVITMVMLNLNNNLNAMDDTPDDKPFSLFDNSYTFPYMKRYNLTVDIDDGSDSSSSIPKLINIDDSSDSSSNIPILIDEERNITNNTHVENTKLHLTVIPTHFPYNHPTHTPTHTPTLAPTNSPTLTSTLVPTPKPTNSPTLPPTDPWDHLSLPQKSSKQHVHIQRQLSDKQLLEIERMKHKNYTSIKLYLLRNYSDNSFIKSFENFMITQHQNDLIIITYSQSIGNTNKHISNNQKIKSYRR
eukprot:77179_1